MLPPCICIFSSLTSKTLHVTCQLFELALTIDNLNFAFRHCQSILLQTSNMSLCENANVLEKQMRIFDLGWAGCVPFTAFGPNIIYDIVSVIQHSVIHY